MSKSIEIRKCVACKNRKNKSELIRIARLGTGEVFVDVTGKANARGAYICKSKSCFDKAVKQKSISRSLKHSVGQSVLEDLRKIVDEQG